MKEGESMNDRIEVIVDPKYMNLKANIYAVVIGVISFASYFAIWGLSTFDFGMDFLWQFYLGFLIGIILHETIHALGFMFVGKAKGSDIKFGFIWKHLTPYAHCKVPMTVKSYRISLLLPVILTGIIPLFIALVFGNWLLVAISVFLIAGGMGDWIVFRKINSFSGDLLLEDHPNAIGCIIYQNKNI